MLVLFLKKQSIKLNFAQFSLEKFLNVQYFVFHFGTSSLQVTTNNKE